MTKHPAGKPTPGFILKGCKKCKGDLLLMGDREIEARCLQCGKPVYRHVPAYTGQVAA